jgi:hypothetical protein
MKRFLYGLAALPFLAGVSLAAQPVPLNDTQMDKVTAGFDITEIETQNTGWVALGVNEAAPSPTPVAATSTTPATGYPYIDVVNTYYTAGHGPGSIAMEVASGFGPP